MRQRALSQMPIRPSRRPSELFRYGVAVLLGASPDAERALRERLSARTENNSSSTTSRRLLEDEFEIRGSHRAYDRRLDQYLAFDCESSGTS